MYDNTSHTTRPDLSLDGNSTVPMSPSPPSWVWAQWAAWEDPPWSTDNHQTYEQRGQSGIQWQVEMGVKEGQDHYATEKAGKINTRRNWPSLTTVIKPSSKGVVLNNNLDRLGSCWSLYDLTPSYSLLHTHNLRHFLYLYLTVSTSWCPRKKSSPRNPLQKPITTAAAKNDISLFRIFTSIFHSMSYPTNIAFTISLGTPKSCFLVNIICSLYHLMEFTNHGPWVGHAVSVKILPPLETL